MDVIRGLFGFTEGQGITELTLGMDVIDFLGMDVIDFLVLYLLLLVRPDVVLVTTRDLFVVILELRSEKVGLRVKGID